MSPQEGVNKFFTAITISEEFRQKFSDPKTRLEAIRNGYLGEKFDLSHEEITRLLLTEGATPLEIVISFLGAERK